MLTRSIRARMRRTPTPLRRTSAMRPVRFTVQGRRLARKLCMDERICYALYLVWDREGVPTFHLSSHRDSRTFSSMADLPEFDIVE